MFLEHLLCVRYVHYLIASSHKLGFLHLTDKEMG